MEYGASKWFKIKYSKVIHCYLTHSVYAEHIMKNAGLKNMKFELKLQKETVTVSDKLRAWNEDLKYLFIIQIYMAT